MSLGAMMAGGNPAEERGRQRDDYYPTPPNVTKAFLNSMYISPEVRFWEPCAGNGAMVDVIKECHPENSIYSSDINPQRADIIQSNFFDHTECPEGHDFLITNPPFNLAVDIIEHAFKIGVKHLALVLKATFWHAKNRQNLFNKYTPVSIMPLTWRPDFLGLGRPTMEVAWCRWNATSGGTIYPQYTPLLKPST